MADLVIVDYRNLCKICSFSTISGQIANIYATEPEEIAHRIAKRLYCIRAENPDASLIFAIDTAPYWRHAYIINWYNARGLEPVGYKANRASQSWPFSIGKESMDALYTDVLVKMSTALEALRVGDEGLEADDVWGVMVASTPKSVKILGVSTDSDWQQLCGGNVAISNPVTGELITTPRDIRAKCIAGDRGDNVMGIPKRKKNGLIGTKMWGIDGAEKLVATHTDTELQQMFINDKETLDRNRTLITLPCPDWNLAEAANAMEACIKPFDIGDGATILDSYGITAPVRNLLLDKTERDIWISKLRAHLQEQNKVAKSKTKDSDEDSQATIEVNSAMDAEDLQGDIDLNEAFP